MKIGILTFHASHNYGSMLQAYALQNYLKEKGHDALIINLRTKNQSRLYRYPLSLKLPFGKRALYESALAFLNPVWLFHECHKWNIYEDFLRNDLALTKEKSLNWEDVKRDISKNGFDCIITGGDQIWNMRCRDFDVSYFLYGELGGVKKVSYSPSFGGKFQSLMTDEEISFIKQNLSGYNCLSVREESMKDFLSKLLNKKIEVVVDPTLLLQVQDYEAIIDEEPIVKGDYLYYYSPFKRPYAEKLAKMLGEYYGLKVVTSFPHIFGNEGIIGIHESGPKEFLNLIKNARMVVGRSFHSVVFSLLFHKNFIAIDGNTDARMKYILNQFGIPERGIITEQNYKQISLPEIDFNITDNIIEGQRQYSEQFLDFALQDN